MENLKKLFKNIKSLVKEETKKNKQIKKSKQQFNNINKDINKLIKENKKKDKHLIELEKQIMKLDKKLVKQNEKLKKSEKGVNFQELVQLTTNNDDKIYNIDVMLYALKDKNKKRTGNHKNAMFDSNGDEYVNILNFPYVRTTGIEIKDIETNIFYNRVDDNFKIIEQIKNVIKNSSDDNDKMISLFLQSQDFSGFIVKSKVEIVKVPPMNLLRQKLKNEGNNSLKINCKYTKYKINLEAKDFKNLLELEHNEYIKTNYRPFSCVLTALINAYYNKFNEKKSDGKRRYKELTYSNLCEVLEIPDKADNNEVDIETVYEKFIKKYNFLSFYVYDAFMNCLLSHKAQDEKKAVSCRVMIKNNHLYQLNNNLKQLQQKPDYEDDERQDIKVSNKYHIVEQVKDKEIKTKEIFCKTMKEIFDNIISISKEKDIQCIRIITNENLNKVLLYCIKNNYEPKVYFNTFLFKLLLYVENKTVYIETGDNNPMYGSQISFESIQEYKQFDNAYNEIYQQVVKKEYISEFHPQALEVDNFYKIQPLVAMLENGNLNEMYDTIDKIKAYTHLLMSIQKVPVFHYFDIYQPYKNSKIEDLTYYIIECIKPTMINKILFGNKYNRTYGFVLKQLTDEQMKDIKILQERKPYKIEEVNFKTAVNELYKKQISTEQKKMIVNKLTGMLELKYNKAHITKVFEDITEAECYKIKYGGKMLPVSVYNENFTDIKEDDTYINLINQNVDCPYYLVNVFNKETLTNGLYPIKDIIYLQQRVELYRMYEKLVNNKIPVYGFKTDSIYTDRSISITHKKIITSNFNLNNEIGNYRIENNKFLPSTLLELKENELIEIQDYTTPKIKTFEDEKDTNTINNYLSDKHSVMIKGEFPGVGKSTLCKNYDNKSLFILPYNKLCQNLKNEGFIAMTYSKVFGLYANDIELKTLKEMDITEYKTVIFDEALLYTPDRLKRLDKLIHRYPNIKFMATGDTEQRNPIGFDDSNYLNKCIDIIFPNQILLTDIKRLTNEKDKSIWKLMKQDIFKSKMTLNEFCKKYKLNTISKIEDVKTTKNICYFNFRCLTVNEFVNNTILKKTERYSVGTEIICRKYEKSKEYVLNTNYTYRIKTLKPKVKIVDETDNKEYTIDNKLLYSHFKLPYALTCDSIQGLSFGEDEKITIFDANIPYTDKKYLWTAITRCRKLENITVFIHPDSEVERFKNSRISQYFTFKCDNYKTQDNKAKRIWKDESFIDSIWFNKMLEKQNYKCYYCQSEFQLDVDDNSNVNSNITADRINNSKAHLQNNCLLACLTCNTSRKNTYNELI